MTSMLHIGTVVDKSTLDPLTDAIVRIMSTPADQKTIRRALDLLGRAADVQCEHITVRDCAFTNIPPLDAAAVPSAEAGPGAAPDADRDQAV